MSSSSSVSPINSTDSLGLDLVGPEQEGVSQLRGRHIHYVACLQWGIRLFAVVAIVALVATIALIGLSQARYIHPIYALYAFSGCIGAIIAIALINCCQKQIAKRDGFSMDHFIAVTEPPPPSDKRKKPKDPEDEGMSTKKRHREN